MFNFIILARKALLAAALVICSGAALAGPNYLVTIHTQGFSGESGLLNFGLGNTGDAPSAIAHMWNFGGAFGDEFDRSSSVTGDLEGGLSMTNGGASNYLTQAVILGGDFSFNLSFSGDYETLISQWDTLFAVQLFDSSLSELWGNVAQFDLVAAYNGEPVAVLVDVNPDLADVVEVPEPSGLLLLCSAIALAGLARRRAVESRG
jgi:hypothetical protein